MNVAIIVGAAAVAVAVALWVATIDTRPCRKCSFCGTPACQLPARHPIFGAVCRRCGRYFGLPGS